LILIAYMSLSTPMYNPSLELLRRATTKEDVREIIDTYGRDVCNEAWGHLTPIERASLMIAREFHGTIIKET